VRSIVSPEDQSATFIELFFDLVFVFSVTQVVGLFHHGIHWSTVGQAVLVFWLVWWAWTQFTWALNAADTTHPLIDLLVLIATGVAFFMAVALPNAFHTHALSFAIPYVVVRIIGLGIYGWVARADRAHRAAVFTFGVLSSAGLLAVLLGGYFAGAAQYWLWGLAIGLDVLAAGIGGRLEGWNLHPKHFGERHGLFVIIALGETLIVAAGGLVGENWNGARTAVAVLAVATSCALWWTYFARAHASLEHAMGSVQGAAQSSMGRDVFSLLHYPMLCGVIAYAVAIEEAVAHPDQPLALSGRAALALGILLFVDGMAVAAWRATSRWAHRRVVFSGATAAAIIGLSGVSAGGSLAMACVGVVLIALAEQNLASYP
jgi:low temperature requirement protein LtrA